jgi:hypothetical protein
MSKQIKTSEEEASLKQALDDSLRFLEQLYERFSHEFDQNQNKLIAECQAHFDALRQSIEARKGFINEQTERLASQMLEKTKRVEGAYIENIKANQINDVLSQEDRDEIVEQRNFLNQLLPQQIKSNAASLSILIETLNTFKLKQREKIEKFGAKLNHLEIVRKNVCLNEFEPNLRFVFDGENVFGSLRLGNYSYDPLGSEMLTVRQSNDLMRLCEFDVEEDNWTLLYRASEHGFDASDFHAKCDGKPNTLTLIQTQGGSPHVFGGFTRVAWSSDGEWKSDSKAFVFSLINTKNKPVKIRAETNAKTHNDAIYCSADYGPTFGRGHDIYVASKSNRNANSYSYLSYTYRHEKYAQGSKEARTLLAGSLNFKINEIEVYTKHS